MRDIPQLQLHVVKLKGITQKKKKKKMWTQRLTRRRRLRNTRLYHNYHVTDYSDSQDIESEEIPFSRGGGNLDAYTAPL